MRRRFYVGGERPGEWFLFPPRPVYSRPLRVREKKGHLESTVDVGDCEFTGSSNS